MSFPNFVPLMRAKLIQSLHLYRMWWKEISLGVYVRLFMLAGILVAAFTNPFFPDINDMNELITLALFNVFQGRCPYNRLYTLAALGDGPQIWYTQDFVNYGPMTLLLHLPAMLYPVRIFGAGFMDFQPSFTVLHGFFDFLMFDRLRRMGHRKGAWALWINPIMVELDLMTHMSVPLFLILMGYEKWRDPFQSVFWLGLGTVTYQYAGILLLFAIAYHSRRYRSVLLGLAPSALVLGVFQAWAMLEGRPLALIHDLLWVQFDRPYVPWPERGWTWLGWTASVPAVIYNLFGTDFVMDWTGGVLRLSSIMNAGALVVTVAMLIRLLVRPDYVPSLTYSVVAILLFLIGSPSGAFHHTLVVVYPFFFAGRESHTLFWKLPESPARLPTWKRGPREIGLKPIVNAY